MRFSPRNTRVFLMLVCVASLFVGYSTKRLVSECVTCTPGCNLFDGDPAGKEDSHKCLGNQLQLLKQHTSQWVLPTG